MPLLLFLLLLLLLAELDESFDAALSLEPALAFAAPVSEAPDFWPERVAAGVFVAFSCSRPEALMLDVALSSPVDFDELALDLSLPLEDVLGLLLDVVLGLLLDVVLGLLLDVVLGLLLEDVLPFIEALPLVEEPVLAAVSEEDDAAPLYLDDEPLYVCDVVLLSVLGEFLFLCMSPSARAEPLASRTTEEKKTGASLRIWAS